MKKLSFLITSPGYAPSCGGIGVLHKLAQLLAEFGEETYLLTTHLDPRMTPKFTWLKSPNVVATQGDIVLEGEDLENTVVIYPDIINENPLDAKHVVRWLLSTPCDGRFKYGADDLVYLFDKRYSTGDAYKPNNAPIEVEGVLNVMFVDFELFKNRQEERIPNSQCFLIRKGVVPDSPMHKTDALFLDDFAYHGDHVSLANVFNKYETLICYDPFTFIATQAVLCGCRAVVVPRKGLSAEQFHSAPLTAGIEYGFEDSEIIWAKNTKGLLVKNLIEAEENSLKTVKSFIRNVYSKIG